MFHTQYDAWTLFTCGWRVTDEAGQLDRVELELLEDGTILDSTEVSVSGETDSASIEDNPSAWLEVESLEGEYDVALTVHTEDGRSQRAETGRQVVDESPSIDGLHLHQDRWGSNTFFVWQWLVTDEAEQLDRIDLELWDDDTLVDESQIPISGGEDDGFEDTPEEALLAIGSDEGSVTAVFTVHTVDGRSTTVSEVRDL